MTHNIPCIRHGVADTRDPQLCEILARSVQTRPEIEDALEQLYLIEGEVWTTWIDEEARSAFSTVMTPVVADQALRVRHLVPVDMPYNYQEDVIDS